MIPDHDPWAALRASTRARIGLGRSGDALPTAENLKFQLAHARARDAVHASVDFGALAADLSPMPAIRVRSLAQDRGTYLRRPDLGRKLCAESREALLNLKSESVDICFVIVDGLSAAAIESHAAQVLRSCSKALSHLSQGPIVLVEQGRVAVGDEIGEILRSRTTVLLIGERPGLSTPDSLGIYLTWEPRCGRQDSERNCVSNIHADGLSYPDAALRVARLVAGARVMKMTGTALKGPDFDLLEEGRHAEESGT